MAVTRATPVVQGLGAAGAPAGGVVTVQGVASMTAIKVDGSAVTQPVSGTVAVSGSVAVTGTFFQATQPISAAALPLPTGAAIASKQPALGTAGTAATDVLTVQGIAAMTALKVDGSAVTQPVSGTVAVSGTVPISAAALPLPAGAAQDATLTGGTMKTKLIDTGGTNVASVSAAGAVKVDGSAVTQPVSGTFFQATQPVSLATNTPDVTDRAGRALGVVTGAFYQAVQPVSFPGQTGALPMVDTPWEDLILRELRRLSLLIAQMAGLDLPGDADLEEGFSA